MSGLSFRKFMIIAIACIGWIFVSDIQTSYACTSGDPSTLAWHISNVDYVVKAHIVERGDANQNVIIRVEKNLVGGMKAPETMLIAGESPVLVEYTRNGYYSCSYGLFNGLSLSNSFYAFVHRNDDGSYGAGIYQFDTPDSTVEVYLEGGNEYGKAERGTGIDVTEREFIELIVEESDEIPTDPNPSPYPLKAPLLIQTQSQEYILPVDWQAPMVLIESEFSSSTTLIYSEAKKCFVAGCIRISPDKLNGATIQEDGTISSTWDYSLEGQELLFSSTSDAMAVWDTCDINIYTTGYPRLNQEQFQLKKVNNVVLNTEDCTQYHALATWTPDGRHLAYSDDEGIWLWDVYTVGSQPRMLLPIESSITLIPNHFSPLGRYLNFSRDDVRKHIDVVSGEIIADGLISPDDKILVNYEQQNGSQGYQICALTTHSCEYGSAMYLSIFDSETGELDSVYAPSVIQKIWWIDNWSFIQVACVVDEPELCSVYVWNTHYSGWYSRPISRGFDFTYDNDQKLIAILQDAHTIRIDGVEIDTSEWFDEEIISIEWLPSLFYYDD